VRRHDLYEVITLADSAAIRDGASPAHGGTPQLHGNLARATFTCTRTRLYPIVGLFFGAMLWLGVAAGCVLTR
jgi:hypothetical protein